MNFYKQAAVLEVTKPEKVQNLVKSLQESEKLKEVVSNLTQIHDTYQQDKLVMVDEFKKPGFAQEYFSMLLEDTPGPLVNDVKSLANAIGVDNFIRAEDFSTISSYIDSLSKAVPETEVAPLGLAPVPSKQPLPGVSTQELEDSVERSMGQQGATGTRSAEVLFGMINALPDTSNKIFTFITNLSLQEQKSLLDHINSFDFENNTMVDVLIRNTKETAELYNKSVGREPKNRQLVLLEESLEEVFNRLEEQQKTEEARRLEGTDADTGVDRTNIPDVVQDELEAAFGDEDGEDSDEDAEVDGDESPAQIDRQNEMLRGIATTLSKEDFKSYIDFTQFEAGTGNPVFNFDILDEEYRVFSAKLDALLKQVAKIDFKSPSLVDIGRSLNNLLYSIKASDLKTYEMIMENEKRLIPRAGMRKEERQRLLDAKIAFESIKDRFLAECISSRLGTGETIYNVPKTIFEYADSVGDKYKIFAIALKIGSAQSARLLISEDGKDVLESYNDSRVRASTYEQIRDHAVGNIEVNFNKKINDFFRLDSGIINKNFIEFCSLRFKSVIKSTLTALYRAEKDYDLKPCPVCFKMVPSSFSSSTTLTKDETGFNGIIFSSFKENPSTEELSPITEEELEAGGKKWTVENNSYLGYKNADEKKFIKRLEGFDRSSGGKTWSEIQELLNSSDPQAQREGWHRRSLVYKQLGGKRLTTTDIKVKDRSIQCPFKPVSDVPEVTTTGGKKTSRSEEVIQFEESQMQLREKARAAGYEGIPASYCGAAISPKKSKHLSDRIAFQPQWNGIVYHDGQPDVKSFINAEGWGSEQDLAKASTQLRGGFKFSSLSFACPCRITKVDAVASSIHANFVMSKSGPAGSGNFVYPTKPDGSEDRELAPGTMTFMVCAAPTSISSFDRNDENQATFILNYLSSTKDKSPQDYYQFLNFLIYNGMDPQDVSSLDRDLERYNQSQVSSGALSAESAEIKSRIYKISKILFASRQSVPSSINSTNIQGMLNGLHLVCPLGHRFNIGHSLKFGGAYSAVYRYSSKDILSKYPSLVKLQGFENAKSLIRSGGLIDPSKLYSYKTKLPYSEWIKVPVEKRAVFPEAGSTDKALLILEIPIDEQGNIGQFVFSRKPQNAVEDAWSSSGSYDTRMIKSKYIPYKVQEDLEKINKGDKSTLENVIGQDQEEVADLDYGKIPGGYFLPGTQEMQNEDITWGIFKRTIEPIVNQKVEALGEIIQKTLKIINTYTKGMVSRAMLNSIMITPEPMNYQFLQDTGFINSIAKVMLGEVGGKSFLYFTDEPDYEEDSEELLVIKERVAAKLAKNFSTELKQVVENIYDYIQDNIFSIDPSSFDKELSIMAISSALSKVMKSEENGENGGVEALLNEESGPDAVRIMSEKIVDETQNIIANITRDAWAKSKEELENKYKYGSRFYYVSYAMKLADVLSVLYDQFCKPENGTSYIGYDIGLDLSDPRKILGYELDGRWVGGLTDSDINEIVFPDMLTAKDKSRIMTQLHGDGIDQYLLRMDRFYFKLKYSIEAISANNVSFRPKSLSSAKEFISSQIATLSPGSTDILDVVEGTFPLKTVRFSTDPLKPEGAQTNFYYKRIPYVSKSESFFNSLAVEKSWIVRPYSARTTGAETKVFTSEQEARAYFESIPQKLRIEAPVYGSQAGYVLEENFYYTSKSKQPRVSAIGKDLKNMTIIEPGSSVPLDGPEEYIIVVENVNINFSLDYRDPNNGNKQTPITIRQGSIRTVNNEVNKYSAKIIVLDDFDAAKFIVNGTISPINFDSSKLQVGRIRPALENTKWHVGMDQDEIALEDVWLSTNFGDGNPSKSDNNVLTTTKSFSSVWGGSVGILLPFNNSDPKANKPSISKAKNIYVPGYKFIISLDGENLDITPLIMKGGSPDDIRGMRERYNKIRSIEEQCIREQESVARRMIGSPQESAEETQAIRSRADAEIRRIVSELENYPINLSTNQSYTLPTSEVAETLTAHLLNPYEAMQIIKSPSSYGYKISDADRARLKDFIIRVYNLQPLFDVITAEANNPTRKDLLLPDASGKMVFDPDDLFRPAKTPEELKAFKARVALINQALKGDSWKNYPGEYFDIVSSDTQDFEGSYFQFVYALSASTQKKKSRMNLDISHIINTGVQAKNMAEELQQLTQGGVGNIPREISQNIIRYLNERRITKHQNIQPRGKPVNRSLDSGNYAVDTLSNEINMRKNKLRGMIDDRSSTSGRKHLLSSFLLDFSDVEFKDI